MSMIMKEFDDEVFFDDEDEDIIQVPEPVKEPEPQDDLTEEVLKLKGISDINKIKFEDESGVITERSWDSLSREEQLNILTEQPQNEELSNEEVDLLNLFRQSGLSAEDWIKSFVPEQQPTYKIDELSDEDVYALDLLEKVGEDNITDEEISEYIENAKKNESLFKKTVDGLRREYIKAQQDAEALAEQELAKQKLAEYDNFSVSINELIRGLNSFAGQDLELSPEDQLNLSDYILQIGPDGYSRFGKDLQNPAVISEVAFWLLNKKEIIEELTKLIQDSYKRGLEANTSKLVFNKPEVNEEDEFLMDDID